MLTLQEIARALDGEISGKGVSAPGPGHSRKDRSLRVFPDPDDADGFRVHSHAADDWKIARDYVRERLGLPGWKPGTNPRPHSSGRLMNAICRKPEPQQQTKLNASASFDFDAWVAAYDYSDRDGTLLFQVLRYVPKTFRQRHPDKRGGWRRTQGDRRVLYRWPEIVSHPDAAVFVCEGEKDADRLASLGHCATTVANGNWSGVDVADLAGRDVVVMEDADDKGVARAAEAAELLHHGANTLRVVRLPGHEPTTKDNGKDVSDWLDADPTNADRLVEICFDTPLWQPDSPGTAPPESDADCFDAVALEGMQFDPVKSVVPGVFVEGLTLFCGKPKLGKSWMLLHAAHAIASGGFTLGQLHCIEGDVLYCALEDNARRLKSRMSKLFGTSPRSARLQFRTKLPRLTEGGLDLLRKWLLSVPKPRMVAIDTLAMVRMPNRKDQSAYDADYAAVIGLRELAHEFGVAIVLVHHVRKMEADDPFDTISGTLGLTGCPDSLVILKRDAAGTMLLGRGRDLADVEKAVTFNKQTCTWSIEGDAEDVRRSAQQQTIVAALRESDEPLTPIQLAALVNMKRPNVRYLLGRLVDEGAISKTGRGKYEIAPKPQGGSDADF